MEENRKVNEFYMSGRKFGWQGRFNPLNVFIESMSYIPDEEKIDKFILTLLMSDREINTDLIECEIKDMHMFLNGYLSATCEDSKK